METSEWNIQNCSVRLIRCDLDIGGSGTWPVESDSETSFVAAHAQVYNGISKVVLKTEHASEDEILSPSLGLWENFPTGGSSFLDEGRKCVVKTEDGAHEETLKTELDIGPTVLQSLLQQKVKEIHPGPGGAGGITPSRLTTIYAQPMPSIKAEDDYCEEISGVSSDDGLVLDLRGSDYINQAVLREQAYGRFVMENIRKDNQCRFVRPQTECETDELKIKADTYTAEKLSECEHCRCYTTIKSDLIKHIQTHMDKKSYKYKTPRPGILKKSKISYTRKTLYKCEQCNYSIPHLGDFKKHIRTHSGEKPYKCDLCKHSSSRLEHLRRHMRTHTRERPYKCEYCEHTASRLDTLKTHMRMHTGKKPYKCERCEYSASRLDILKGHMTNHTGEKSYKCEQCDYSVHHLGDLKKHIHTHTGVKPYKCKYCKYSASQVSSLNAHMRTHKYGSKTV